MGEIKDLMDKMKVLMDEIKDYDGKMPVTPFQSRFRINDEFYSAEYIRKAILECFPPLGEDPFHGLLLIENFDSISIEDMMQKLRSLPRDRVLDELIKESHLVDGTRLDITESQRYRNLKYNWIENPGLTFEATDLGYIAEGRLECTLPGFQDLP